MPSRRSHLRDNSSRKRTALQKYEDGKFLEGIISKLEWARDNKLESFTRDREFKKNEPPRNTQAALDAVIRCFQDHYRSKSLPKRIYREKGQRTFNPRASRRWKAVRDFMHHEVSRNRCSKKELDMIQDVCVVLCEASLDSKYADSPDADSTYSDSGYAGSTYAQPSYSDTKYSAPSSFDSTPLFATSSYRRFCPAGAEPPGDFRDLYPDESKESRAARDAYRRYFKDVKPTKCGWGPGGDAKKEFNESAAEAAATGGEIGNWLLAAAAEWLGRLG